MNKYEGMTGKQLEALKRAHRYSVSKGQGKRYISKTYKNALEELEKINQILKTKGTK